MVGQGPGFATDVPGIFVFEQTFRALRYNTGAAASIVMLLLVAAVMVPYLYRSTSRRRDDDRLPASLARALGPADRASGLAGAARSLALVALAALSWCRSTSW